MIRAVIDTNCLLLSVPPKNPEYWLYEAFRDKQFIWILSNEILTEYEEILGAFYSRKTADIVLEILLSASNVVFVEPYFRWKLVSQDPDDDKFSDVALAANADHIVSQDRHLRALNKIDFPKISVLNITEFKKVLSSHKPQQQ